MTETQKELLASFPKRDMGHFGNDEDEEGKDAPELVELDFVEAAA